MRDRHAATSGEALVAAAEAGLAAWRWQPTSAWIFLPQGRAIARRARDLADRLPERLGGGDGAPVPG